MINNSIVDFIVKNNVQLLEYLKSNPSVTVSPDLTGDFSIAYTDEANIAEVSRSMQRAFIAGYSDVLGLVDIGDLQLSEPSRIYNTTDLGGKGTIFAIIDTGIDYLNTAFMNRDRTSRIISIYDQTIEGNAPYGFGVGSEFDQATINEAIKSKNPRAIVPSVDDVGHGTFLASVAAGSKQNDFIGIAYETELMVVKLKKASPYYLRKYLVPLEQKNAFESTDIMLGVEYIVKKALELDRPVVICLGLGSNYSGHDGYSLFEQYLCAVSKIKGVCICVPGGNESLTKHHFYGCIPASDDYQDVALKVGEDAGDIYLTMWNNAPDVLRVSVTSPTGSLVESVSSKTATEFRRNLITDRCHVAVEYNYPVYGSGSQNTVIKLLGAVPGIWTIRVHGEYIRNGCFHIWLPIAGFVSPNVEFVIPYKNYTITIPGTSPSLITSGAYDIFQDALSLESSWGPNRNGKTSPNLVSPGVDIRGIYPGGYGKMSGTGVATSIVAGSCAILMQWCLMKNQYLMNTYQIMTALIQGAARPAGLDYPNDRWGYGLLDLNNTLEKI